MRYRYRSFFWPAVLILIGVFALLVNAGLLPVERLNRLIDLWPLILVVIGLELIARRAVQGIQGAIAAALIVLLALGGAVAYVALGPTVVGGTHSLDTSDTIGDLDQVALSVDVGAARMTVSGSDALGPNLYRAHIEYSGPAPEVRLDRSLKTLVISQPGDTGFFQSREFALTLQISTRVHWTIGLKSGAATATFNLARVQVSAMELDTGASQDDITLGPPTGYVAIIVNGGALTVHLRRPRGTAATVSVQGGAISLSADGQQMHGIGNETWTSSDFGHGDSGYKIGVSGGACTVTIDTSAPST